MKKIIGIFIVIGLLVNGCGKGTSSPGITEDTILIGNIQDLSGPMKELGALLPSGSNLYFDYVNENGGVHGRQIKMIVEDHSYNPQKAVAAAKKLIEKDQVFCLYHVIGTSPCEALRPILAESGVPLIAPATQSGSMSDMSRQAADLIFHTDTGYDKQTRILVDNILSKNANAKIGIIYQDDDYGENVLKGTAIAEEKAGISVQREAYQRGATDFAGQVANLMKGGVTDVIIAGIVKEPIIVMKTAVAMGYAPNFYGTSPTMDHRISLAAGSAGEGFTSVNFASLWNSDAPSALLYNELCEKAGIPAKMKGMYHFYGFITAQVLVEGLERTGKFPTRTRLVNALETFKNWDGGAFPPITYNQNDHAGTESVILVQVTDGVQNVISDWIE
ncbi:MAG: ABC transporter substrate-binding protein [Candidatus Marinimicrobia bacterium]|jgi:ABC-type branched-subunit amino acid transport system substrate-binding protein|nr:ABC transporter substrate-binding protein [Candidatus Neomarinimicrobiota bacterium]MBT3501714.1 ABC transporter substrate-binding protein [Candidatus Neomarinimicrobiota bacterium]MBT3839701.1 ABC transporter substrate-binding protein [Candidatus Neomarinimicrobiota bacterium]MBT3999099.1 ABC transporter substrate-binding protein [Candidatus Neomarinimicrobiota bacterium]MBT4282326.1 ABC transporter substrate-binding protein [Candidatus Neomarinimicrobiota bacterium]